MLAVRVSVLVAASNRFELLLPTLVVPLAVQLSPPARKTVLLPGSSNCELQKRSVPVPLDSTA